MKAFVLRAILGLILILGLGAKTVGQCTSTLSFGAGAAPVTSNDSVSISPCILYTDFATLLSVQAGNTYAVTMSNPTYVSIYNGSNAVPANLVTSGMANNTISFVAPASGNYEIVFYANATCPIQIAPGCQTARVSCTTCPAPIDTDSCHNAPLVTAGTNAFTTLNATGQDVSSCASGDSLDVWVRYSPPTSGLAGITTCQSGFNTSLQVFDGCPCDGGNELACNDDNVGLVSIGGLSCSVATESSIQVWMESSSTYYIRFSAVAGLKGSGRFTIVDPVVQTGELCSDAFLLQDGVTFNTTLAGFTGSFSSMDQLCSNSGSNNGMFFRLPVETCGDVDLSITHTTSSFNWFLLSGDCSGFSVNSSNSASISTSGCGTNSVNFRDESLWMKSATPGSRFTFPKEYVLYIEASGAGGPLSVSYNLLNSSPSPAHDDCDSAYVLGQGDGFSPTNLLTDAHSASVSCANTDASDDNSTRTITPAGGCLGSSVDWNNTLWYEWTAPTSQIYTLNIYNQACTPHPQSLGTGLQFMVTSVKDCKDPGRTSAGAVNDVSGNSCYATGTTSDLSFTFLATANTTYYIVVSGYDAAMCGFDMLISENALFPTGLYGFNGKASPLGNLLEWKLGDFTEQIASFDIQRSTDDAFFHTIGKLGKDGSQSYDFLDAQPEAVLHYYRLKILTADGRFHFSHSVEIYNDRNDVAVFAHEGGALLQVALGKKREAVRLDILTATGQRVYLSEWPANASREQYIRPSLASGVYFYRISSSNSQQSGKFIRQ